MTGIQRISVVLAASTTMGIAPPEVFSAAELAALDPSVRMVSLCSGRDRGSSMPGMLALAALVVEPQLPAAIPLYDGLGKIDFPITTAQPLAQRYFNQGMGFAYGFNHAAAIASFRAAQKLDPGCAMCWWGEALAHGPNINAPITPDANALALKAIGADAARLARTTPTERALIMALATRYSARPDAVRATLDGAFADAMLALARVYPAHDDISLLAAEAAMDTLPWDYWEPDKQSAKPRLGEAVRLVEAVMARNPDHPQGNHLYIHLMENGPDPKRAEAAADRLAKPLAGDAGHMVHMPAHIYYRLGRWKDSMRVNLDAARKDEAYISQADDKGFVRYGYYPHNVHFIVTSAQMAGDLPTAIREAKRGEARRLTTTPALAKAPNNGWALYGLAASERALGRRTHAAAAQLTLGRACSGDPRWLRMERL